jgi:hypothetical protein
MSDQKRPPSFEQLQKELHERIERELLEDDEPRTDADVELEKLKRDKPGAPESDAPEG